MSLVRAGFRLPGRRHPFRADSHVRRAIDPAVAAVFEIDIRDLCAATRRSPRAAFAR